MLTAALFLSFSGMNARGNPVLHLLKSSLVINTETSTAYPNPFTESTTIFYSPPADEVVSVKLYNSEGQLLNELFEDLVEKGELYRFELDGRFMNPGTYYYTIEAGGNILHQKIELVR
jgi:serine protease AprX